MKKYVFYIVTLLFTMIYPPLLKAAAFDPSGKWTYNVVNDNRHLHLCQVKPGETRVVELTGDVYVYDRIFVGSATYLGSDSAPATLIIRNKTGHKVTIHNRLTASEYVESNVFVDGVWKPWSQICSQVLFSVFVNAKLVIEGSADSPIHIDGGSTVVDVPETPFGFMECQGSYDLKYVTIENVKLSDKYLGDSSLIKLAPYRYNTGTSASPIWNYCKMGSMSFDHCTIRNVSCPGSYGAVMLNCFNMSLLGESVNNRETNKISFTNCEIYNVSQGGVAGTKTVFGESVDKATGTAGLIRFRGGWVGDLYMKNTKIHDNTSAGDCAGVYWNAVGYPVSGKHPVFTMDGCEFYNNKVTNSGACGGAMVLQGEFKFEGAPTKVYNNSAPGHGGGIAVKAYTGLDPISTSAVNINMDINDKLLLEGNTSEEGGGMSILCGTDCNLPAGSQIFVNINGCTINNNRADNYGGGIGVRCYENTSIPVTINLNSGTFSGNQVTANTTDIGGGAIAFRGGTIKSAPNTTCYFENNTSTYQGGAIRADWHANVSLGSLKFSNCSAQYGGAITIHGGASMEMNDVEINNCEASMLGGGMSLYWNASAHIKSAVISGCKAKGGGAISVFPYSDGTAPSSLTIDQATITNNEAIYDASVADSGCGGAILTDASKLTINDGTISNNTARDGGGVYLKLGSTFGMTKGVISDNVATRRGGGVYSSGVGFTLQDGLITRNSAGDFGGGIYYDNGSNTDARTIAGGTVSYNKAYGGGGIYTNAHRKSKLNINNTIMEYNEAQLGGGLLTYFSELQLSNAYVRYNKALKVPGGDVLTSMYGYIHCSGLTADTDAPKQRTLGGIGGGIYSSFKSHLTFDTQGGFGIYANVADYGADDIFALAGDIAGYDWEDESITLPKIAELGLSGYNVPVSQGNLFWAEDYIVNDENYDQGTNKLGVNGKNKRYRTSVEQMSLDLANTAVASGKYTNKYLMLAVGSGVGKATLRKKGLKQGETCVFKVYSQDTNQNQYHQSTGAGDRPVNPLNCYMTIMMVGGGTEVDEKTLILPTGNWVVQESPYWAWTYNKVDDTNPPVNTLEDPLLIGKAVTATGDPAVFEFTNTKRTDIVVPHDEEVIQNSLQK